MAFKTDTQIEKQSEQIERAQSHYVQMGQRLMDLPLEPDLHNVVFVKDGQYSLETFEPAHQTFDKLIERMNRYNANPKAKKRCLMVSSPNWLLRELSSCKDAVISYAAPMTEPLHSNFDNRGSGQVLPDEYLKPADSRQDAADIVSSNDDLVALAEQISNGTLTLHSRKPFE